MDNPSSLPVLLVTANVGSVFEDALGNLYFAHRTIENLQMWNFLTHEWDLIEGKNIHTGNIESVATKEKAKFPQQFFPECKWSRKGFLRTRWSLNGTIFDLVNIHLFHDASNLAACEEYPSVYCKSRRRALVHTLERFHKDTVNKPVPYFVFGDFNFRCDTEGVIKKLTEDLTEHRVQNPKNDSTKVQYRDSDGANVLTVGKKEFNHTDQSTFKENWLRQFDRELDSLRSILFEYPVTFPPSYPYEEDPQQPGSYMSTRCPAWCDRILVSPAARKLIDEDREGGKPQSTAMARGTYGIIGETVCMGDHKPVYLNIRIKSSQGILNYCSCDTHAHKRVEHIPNLSTINVSVNNLNNSSSNHLVSKFISDSTSSSDMATASNSKPNHNHLNSLPTVANESISNNSSSSTPPAPTTSGITPDERLPSPNKPHCSYCFDHIQTAFDEFLSELELFPTSYAVEHDGSTHQNSRTLDASNRPVKVPPPVSISVFDTDSNANVCMCSLYSSSFSISGSDYRRSRSGSMKGLDQTDPQICPNCQNIIKHQPMEHRKTLVSRRLMLANDVIVSRIDAHYLNTFMAPSGTSSSGTTKARQFEPYTPESVESHSPVPESVERQDLEDEDPDDDSSNDPPDPCRASLLQTTANHTQSLHGVKLPTAAIATTNCSKKILTKSGDTTAKWAGVSPRQLKARLEKLQRLSSDRQKQVHEGKSANKSDGITLAATIGGTALGAEELLVLESGDVRLETVAPGTSPIADCTDGGQGRGRRRWLSGRNDRKQDADDEECCQWHCCAIT
ncbi:uncharacterized protein LOC129765610 isoform X2 [Toxorhynchites rutilus septentrionalis]|uniref:uncharacterized protein LOC129765610 isoform X2 n=1 Tax=Toxorhynchites rutilus septentrionalis TaxID=329112 RepID=UPI0024799EFC|nr:uncharacterized protein LOC129765610 isoform X2 [Toxorhynchites rutilus septentrionalis]